MYKLYRFIAFISVLIRQFILPNPFEPLGENIPITINEIVIMLTPDLVNWIAEPILHTITFTIVGIYYKKGYNNPSVGSFLYLIFYIFHVGLIYIISCFRFSWIAVIIVLALYLALHIIINVLKNKLSTLSIMKNM